ncbi:MAG: HAMP domain-containing sensor histidine kinase [Desulfobacteraceae bacterium]
MNFNLRQKIFLHFFIFFSINGAIWVFSFYSNTTMNQKLRIIEKKNDLLNTILEARRYEKNFFLKYNIKDLQESISYIEKTEKMQKNIENAFAGLLGDETSIKKRSHDITAYKNIMQDLKQIYTGDFNHVKDKQTHAKIRSLQEKVTRLGRKITTELEWVEKNERSKVFNLLNESRTYLLISMFSLFVLTVLTAFFLVVHVNHPLKSIEDGIRKIARGDFTKIPDIRTGDEFESLASSLNNMIDELEKRKQQLVQAEKMSSLGTLTSGVAHELNNPINNISTSIQILMEEIEEPETEYKKELLIQAEDQIDRARDIIRALLEFSRQTEFFIEQIDFKKLVQSTMHLISGEIPSNISIKTDIPKNLTGRMDVRRIQQVLLNLIINGIHAMGPKGGELLISALKDRDTSTFTFKVSDTGIGMSEDTLHKIFDPFFSTREVGEGTGLGLSIVHGIIEQHGGTIEVESREGKGTTFIIELPEQI